MISRHGLTDADGASLGDSLSDSGSGSEEGAGCAGPDEPSEAGFTPKRKRLLVAEPKNESPSNLQHIRRPLMGSHAAVRSTKHFPKMHSATATNDAYTIDDKVWKERLR